jgi:hypothetical protein
LEKDRLAMETVPGAMLWWIWKKLRKWFYQIKICKERENDLCNWFMLFRQWLFYINIASEITVLKMNQGARRFQHSSKCVCWTPLNRKLPFKWKANDNQIIKWLIKCSNNSHGISSSDLLLRLSNAKVNAEHPLRCL